MKDYWLAKLISSVTEVDSRKRLQKSIYLLQRAGCPLRCDYLLHYYGPYSFELAGLIDQLEGARIIEETPEQLSIGVLRYRSKIAPRGRKVLDLFERTSEGHHAKSKIEAFIPRFQKLNNIEPWVLELAATVAYFHEDDWTKARSQTAKFKHVSPNDAKLISAEELAKKFKGSA